MNQLLDYLSAALLYCHNSRFVSVSEFIEKFIIGKISLENILRLNKLKRLDSIERKSTNDINCI